MRPRSTEEDHRRLKRDAVRGAVIHVLVQGLSAVVLLWVRTFLETEWLRGGVLVLAVVDLLTIPPIYFVLKQRLKEIKGGEIDAARKY